MGCLFSIFKLNNSNNNNKNNNNNPLLITNKYCHICNTDFLFNEYYKHIPECNRRYREKNNINLK